MSSKKASQLNEEGIAFLEKEKYRKAAELFEKALSEAYLPAILFNLTLAWEKSGEFDKALETVDKALKLSPADCEIVGEKALILYYLNQRKEASTLFEKAVNDSSCTASVWNNKGVFHFTGGQFESAKECFEKAVELNQHFYDAWYNLADTYEELGDTEREAKAREKLKELDNG